MKNTGKWLRKRFTGKSSLPHYSILLIISLVIAYSLHLGFWKRTDRIIASDVLHYYAYLPAFFIYKDIELEFVNQDPDAWVKKMWPSWSPIYKNVIMTTMGMSIMYAPAFLTTHAIMQLSGFDDDGYAPPYRFGLIVGGWVYLVLALYFLKRILLRYYSHGVTAITLLMVGVGTNLFHYASAEPTMSHQYSFFLFAAFLLLTIRWHEKPRLWDAILLGVVSGLITLVRPSNIIVGLIFVFWQAGSFTDFRSKFKLLKNYYPHLLVLILAGFMMWIPQLLYWKQVTGTYFYYSYGDQQGFYFNNPQIINSLFSYRKGWLVYTPIMLFAFMGMALLWRKNRSLFLPLLIFSVVNIYIVSSWWAWWYGGGFGLRAYIESYVFFALAMGAFVQYVLSWRFAMLKLPVLLMIVSLIGLNLFQTRQQYFGSIHYIGMTKEAYWHSFLRLKPYGNYYHLLTIPDMEKARKGIYEYEPFIKPAE